MAKRTIVVVFDVDVKDPRMGYSLEFLADLDSALGGVPQTSEWDEDSEDREDFLILGMELQ